MSEEPSARGAATEGGKTAQPVGRVRSEGLGVLGHIADATGSAPGEAPPLAKLGTGKPPKQRAIVWKSSGPANPVPAATAAAAAAATLPSGAGVLTAADLSALQATLNKSVTASVRESLQASLHSELAEVKRALRSAEELAAVRRKQDEGRHQALLLQLDVAKDGAQEAQANAVAVAAQAQAAAEAAAHEAQARADRATLEAKQALAAQLKSDATRRELEAELVQTTTEMQRERERLSQEREVALREATSAADTKVRELTETASKRIAELERDAAAAERDNEEWAEATLSRQLVDMGALSRELKGTEQEAVSAVAQMSAAVAAARAEGERAGRASLEAGLRERAEAIAKYEKQVQELEAQAEDLTSARQALAAERESVEAERTAGKEEVEQWKRLAREQLSAERESLVAEMEAMRITAGREAATEALQREATSILEQREQLSQERLQLNASSQALTRESAAARAELMQLEESARLTREGLLLDRRAIDEERAAIQALLERDRSDYADALKREREAAAQAAANVEEAHAAATGTLRRQLVAANTRAEELSAAHEAMAAAKSVAEDAVQRLQHDMANANESLAAARIELSDANARVQTAEGACEAANAEANSLRVIADGGWHAISSTLSRELRALESEARRAKDSEAAARAAQAHSEAVLQRTFEQLQAEAAAAKGIADERIRVVTEEAAWARELLERQLGEAREALRVASEGLVTEQSAVLALRSMLLVADADVAAMRGAAAHYAALGGEEAGSLREAISRAEVGKREAIEAERRRADQMLERERDHFEGTLGRLRESSFAAQAKLQSQLAWMGDALEERTRQLHSEREAFDVALAKEREATAAAHEASRRVLQEVAERQAARHAAELSEQGQAMEAQLAVEREAFLEQLVDHRSLHGELADAKAEARAAKLELSDLRSRYAEERSQWAKEATDAREGWQLERQRLEDAAHEAVAKAESALAASHEAEAARAAQVAAELERQVSSLSAALERERELHRHEAARLQSYASELEQRVHKDRIADVYRSTEELEEQLAEAQRLEEALKGRMRALTEAAQAEVERGTAQVAELHEARQRQLRLEHSQLSELHAQSGASLKAMAEGREALANEVAAHRRTQEQLLALHETMQRERDAFANEVAGDRGARAQLPVVQAELAAARQLLDQMSKEAAQRPMLGDESGGKDGGGGSTTPGRMPSKRGAGSANASSKAANKAFPPRTPTQPPHW